MTTWKKKTPDFPPPSYSHSLTRKQEESIQQPPHTHTLLHQVNGQAALAGAAVQEHVMYCTYRLGLLGDAEPLSQLVAATYSSSLPPEDPRTANVVMLQVRPPNCHQPPLDCPVPF